MATAFAGTEGRVYGGDPRLIHVTDGERAKFGRDVAEYIDHQMRFRATPTRTLEERATQPLCPGCYMVVIFNAARELAIKNGQSLSELGRSLSEAFASLAEDSQSIEEIEVKLDPEPEDNAHV